MTQKSDNKIPSYEGDLDKTSFDLLLGNILESSKDSFMVFDKFSCHSHGFNFRTDEPIGDIEGPLVYPLWGICSKKIERTPQIGDRFALRNRAGTRLALMIYSIHMDEHNDFDALCVCIDPDYKGGIGLRGENMDFVRLKSDNSLLPKADRH